MERRSLWQAFYDIKDNMPDVPWLAIGDFNVIKSMDERSDFFMGMPYPISSRDFQHFIYNLEFMDLPHLGHTFTWTNKRSWGFVAKKLDRFFVNTCWFQSFLDFQAEFSPPEFSDHYAGRLFVSNRTVKQVGSFKLFYFLTRHKDFLNTVYICWCSVQPYGTQMFRL